MKRKTHSIVLVLLIGCCISCKSNMVKTKRSDSKNIESIERTDRISDSIRYTRILKSGLYFDKEWHKTLEARKAQAKEFWIRGYANKYNFFESRIPEDDVQNTKTFIVETYRIPVSSLLKWDTATSVQKMMSICRDSAVLYAFPKGHCPWQMHFRFVEGKCDSYLYFAMPVALNPIADLYYKRQLPIISVRLVEKSGYVWHFVVFIDERGELMSIRLGTIDPLKEILKSYRYPNKRMVNYFN